MSVAPRVGAWIEISNSTAYLEKTGVAPRVGAWIEITYRRDNRLYETSRPVWARGLKLQRALRRVLRQMSRPVWARGLKFIGENVYVVEDRRAPCGRVD